MDAKEIIAGLDKETLDAIAQFGGEYMDYLWWTDVIVPNFWTLFIILIIAFIIYGAVATSSNRCDSLDE